MASQLEAMTHVNQNQHGSALDTAQNGAQKNNNHYIYVYKYRKREKKKKSEKYQNVWTSVTETCS